MDKSVKNIVIIAGGLILARYLYKKHFKKTTIVKQLEGQVDACEELAMNMRFANPEAKDKWIYDCINNAEKAVDIKDKGVAHSECKKELSMFMQNNPAVRINPEAWMKECMTKKLA